MSICLEEAKMIIFFTKTGQTWVHAEKWHELFDFDIVLHGFAQNSSQKEQFFTYHYSAIKHHLT